MFSIKLFPKFSKLNLFNFKSLASFAKERKVVLENEFNPTPDEENEEVSRDEQMERRILTIDVEKREYFRQRQQVEAMRKLREEREAIDKLEIEAMGEFNGSF